MTTKEAVERFIIDELMMGDEKTKLDPNQSLIGIGILDSLALLQLVAFIEEQFEITFDDDEVIPENLETVNVITAIVEKKKQGN